MSIFGPQLDDILTLIDECQNRLLISALILFGVATTVIALGA